MPKLDLTPQRLAANRTNSVKGGLAVKAKAISNYNSNPKFCQYCNIQLPFEQKNNKFCCQSHAATFNNTGKIKIERHPCAHCGSPTLRKYCSVTCSANGSKKYHPDEYLLIKRRRMREASANYRAKLRTQTPLNANRAAIKEFYDYCPKGYEVDHIIPISKGGLHSLENLQYLTRSENRRKSNK
jgi:hypothetical protein